VTYDDTYSLGDKAAYAKSAGMGGCFTWALDQVCSASRSDTEDDVTDICCIRRMMVLPFSQPFAQDWEFDRIGRQD
jgi:GH18 family chitinase